MTKLPEHHKTDRLIRRIERLSRRQEAFLSCISNIMELTMAGQAELQAQIDELAAAVAADQAADQAVVDQLDQIIKDLPRVAASSRDLFQWFMAMVLWTTDRSHPSRTITCC